MLGFGLVPQGGWPLATGFGPKLCTLTAFKEQSAKKYHMTITIYPDEYEVEGFELLLDLIRHGILEFPSHVGCTMSSQDKMLFQDRWRADRSEA